MAGLTPFYHRQTSVRVTVSVPKLVILFLVCAGAVQSLVSGDDGLLSSCDFEGHDASGSDTCSWLSSRSESVKWILTNQPSETERAAGLDTDHSQTGSGYFWVARLSSLRANGNNRAVLEKRVPGGIGRVLTLWYFITGDGSSLSVELVTSETGTPSDQTTLTLYRADGGGGDEQSSGAWVQTPQIRVADCRDYTIRLVAAFKSRMGSVAIDNMEFTEDSRVVSQKPNYFLSADSFCWNTGLYIPDVTAVHTHGCCCADGYAGAFCQHNVDECVTERGTELCQNGATCLDQVDGFTCRCPSGYTGVFCETDIDDCEKAVCERGGTCLDLPGGFECVCPPGYTGRKCEAAVDGCRDITCLHGGRCVDLRGDFRCQCPPGYTGQLCEQDIDECQDLACGTGAAACINGDGSYWCVCSPGFHQPSDGRPRCVDSQDSCLSSPCHYGGTCVDRPAGFECRCTPGTGGRLCELDYDECTMNYCRNGGTCVDGLNSRRCDCLPGYTGERCEVDDRHAICSTRCRNADSCEVISGEEVVCRCRDGYHGEYCQLEINECLSNPCVEGLCRDSLAGYQCRCTAGWTGAVCDAVIDSCSGRPCGSNGTCHSTPDVSGYVCVCDPGFTGEHCDRAMTWCDAATCLNGGTCRESDAYNQLWSCDCVYNFVGRRCETEVKETYRLGARAELDQKICSDFWSLPTRLQAWVLGVCVASVLAVFIAGACVVECAARRKKRRSSPAPTLPARTSYFQAS